MYCMGLYVRRTKKKILLKMTIRSAIYHSVTFAVNVVGCVRRLSSSASLKNEQEPWEDVENNLYTSHQPGQTCGGTTTS